MSSKDKTQEKLIASIRKTQLDSTVQNRGDQVKSKSTATSSLTKKQKRPANKKEIPQKNNSNYQSVKRVWPD